MPHNLPIRLSLTFSLASRLPSKQKCKLIKSQSEKLTLARQEIDALLTFCLEKNCVNSGLALVYEYAEYIDTLKDLISRILYQIDLLGKVATPSATYAALTSSTALTTVNTPFAQIFLQYLFLIIRLFFIFSRWRRLQASFLPILLKQGAGAQSPLLSIALIDILLINLQKYSNIYLNNNNNHNNNGIIKKLLQKMLILGKYEQALVAQWQTQQEQEEIYLQQQDQQVQKEADGKTIQPLADDFQPQVLKFPSWHTLAAKQQMQQPTLTVAEQGQQHQQKQQQMTLQPWLIASRYSLVLDEEGEVTNSSQLDDDQPLAQKKLAASLMMTAGQWLTQMVDTYDRICIDLKSLVVEYYLQQDLLNSNDPQPGQLPSQQQPADQIEEQTVEAAKEHSRLFLRLLENIDNLDDQLAPAYDQYLPKMPMLIIASLQPMITLHAFAHDQDYADYCQAQQKKQRSKQPAKDEVKKEQLQLQEVTPIIQTADSSFYEPANHDTADNGLITPIHAAMRQMILEEVPVLTKHQQDKELQRLKEEQEKEQQEQEQMQEQQRLQEQQEAAAALILEQEQLVKQLQAEEAAAAEVEDDEDEEEEVAKETLPVAEEQGLEKEEQEEQEEKPRRSQEEEEEESKELGQEQGQQPLLSNIPQELVQENAVDDVEIDTIIVALTNSLEQHVEAIEQHDRSLSPSPIQTMPMTPMTAPSPTTAMFSSPAATPTLPTSRPPTVSPAAAHLSSPVLSLSSPKRCKNKLARDYLHQSSYLYQALKAVDRIATLQREEKAARKIKLWFRWFLPKKKLTRRLQHRQVVSLLLSQVIFERAWSIIQQKEKQRHRLLRQGAAYKIQAWYQEKLPRRQYLQQQVRLQAHRQRVLAYLARWTSCCWQAYFIFKYLKRVLPKLYFKRAFVRQQQQQQHQLQAACSSPPQLLSPSQADHLLLEEQSSSSNSFLSVTVYLKRMRKEDEPLRYEGVLEAYIPLWVYQQKLERRHERLIREKEEIMQHHYYQPSSSSQSGQLHGQLHDKGNRNRTVSSPAYTTTTSTSTSTRQARQTRLQSQTPPPPVSSMKRLTYAQPATTATSAGTTNQHPRDKRQPTTIANKQATLNNNKHMDIINDHDSHRDSNSSGDSHSSQTIAVDDTATAEPVSPDSRASSPIPGAPPGGMSAKQQHRKTRLQIERTSERAAMSIQRAYRRHHAHHAYLQRMQQGAMSVRIAMFLRKCLLQRLRRRNRHRDNAAVRLQQWFRGLLIRREIYTYVTSGLKLNEIWRKHCAYHHLKDQLRRLDRPFTIVLQGLRNLQMKMVNADQVKVRVSVYWNPLLHIVKEKDYDSIIGNKRPQYMYETSFYKVLVEEPPAVTDVNNNNNNVNSNSIAAMVAAAGLAGSRQHSSSSFSAHHHHRLSKILLPLTNSFSGSSPIAFLHRNSGNKQSQQQQQQASYTDHLNNVASNQPASGQLGNMQQHSIDQHSLHSSSMHSLNIPRSSEASGGATHTLVPHRIAGGSVMVGTSHNNSNNDNIYNNHNQPTHNKRQTRGAMVIKPILMMPSTTIAASASAPASTAGNDDNSGSNSQENSYYSNTSQSGNNSRIGSARLSYDQQQPGVSSPVIPAQQSTPATTTLPVISSRRSTAIQPSGRPSSPAGRPSSPSGRPSILAAAGGRPTSPSAVGRIEIGSSINSKPTDASLGQVIGIAELASSGKGSSSSLTASGKKTSFAPLPSSFHPIEEEEYAEEEEEDDEDVEEVSEGKGSKAEADNKKKADDEEDEKIVDEEVEVEEDEAVVRISIDDIEGGQAAKTLLASSPSPSPEGKKKKSRLSIRQEIQAVHEQEQYQTQAQRCEQGQQQVQSQHVADEAALADKRQQQEQQVQQALLDSSEHSASSEQAGSNSSQHSGGIGQTAKTLSQWMVDNRTKSATAGTSASANNGKGQLALPSTSSFFMRLGQRGLSNLSDISNDLGTARSAVDVRIAGKQLLPTSSTAAGIREEEGEEDGDNSESSVIKGGAASVATSVVSRKLNGVRPSAKKRTSRGGSSTGGGRLSTTLLESSPVSYVRRTLSLALRYSTMVVPKRISFSASAGSLDPFGYPIRPSQRSRQQPVKKVTLACSLEEEIVKIPGCHGNSVIKFEVFDGQRKMGNTYFFMAKEGELMYWGGSYTKEVAIVHSRRAVQYNSHIIVTKEERGSHLGKDSPLLEFQIIAGAPLRSRCQWSRLVVHGRGGPLKRFLQSSSSSRLTNIWQRFSWYDAWLRYYLSLDEFGLYFFENKFSSKYLYMIPCEDFLSVTINISGPESSSYSILSYIPFLGSSDDPGAGGGGGGGGGSSGGGSSSKAGSKGGRGGNGNGNQGGGKTVLVEDINNVILTTKNRDEIYMRFPDAPSRNAWFECFDTAIYHHQHSSTSLQEQHDQHHAKSGSVTSATGWISGFLSGFRMLGGSASGGVGSYASSKRNKRISQRYAAVAAAMANTSAQQQQQQHQQQEGSKNSNSPKSDYSRGSQVTPPSAAILPTTVQHHQPGDDEQVHSNHSNTPYASAADQHQHQHDAQHPFHYCDPHAHGHSHHHHLDQPHAADHEQHTHGHGNGHGHGHDKSDYQHTATILVGTASPQPKMIIADRPRKPPIFSVPMKALPAANNDH